MSQCPTPLSREFVGLKPKMYSLDLGASEIKVAKGVNRSVLRRKLKHQIYKDCLFHKNTMHHSMTNIRIEKHQLHTYKISLSPFDDKRYFMNENTSYAYGHFKIQELENLHTHNLHISVSLLLVVLNIVKIMDHFLWYFAHSVDNICI